MTTWSRHCFFLNKLFYPDHDGLRVTANNNTPFKVLIWTWISLCSNDDVEPSFNLSSCKLGRDFISWQNLKLYPVIHSPPHCYHCFSLMIYFCSRAWPRTTKDDVVTGLQWHDLNIDKDWKGKIKIETLILFLFFFLIPEDKVEC